MKLESYFIRDFVSLKNNGAHFYHIIICEIQFEVYRERRQERVNALDCNKQLPCHYDRLPRLSEFSRRVSLT